MVTIICNGFPIANQCISNHAQWLVNWKTFAPYWQRHVNLSKPSPEADMLHIAVGVCLGILTVALMPRSCLPLVGVRKRIRHGAVPGGY
jgi:hypothetical protein